MLAVGVALTVLLILARRWGEASYVGLNIALLSTSHGIKSDRQCRKLGIGGELLCEVW